MLLWENNDQNQIEEKEIYLTNRPCLCSREGKVRTQDMNLDSVTEAESMEECLLLALFLNLLREFS